MFSFHLSSSSQSVTLFLFHSLSFSPLSAFLPFFPFLSLSSFLCLSLLLSRPVSLVFVSHVSLSLSLYVLIRTDNRHNFIRHFVYLLFHTYLYIVQSNGKFMRFYLLCCVCFFSFTSYFSSFSCTFFSHIHTKTNCIRLRYSSTETTS